MAISLEVPEWNWRASGNDLLDVEAALRRRREPRMLAPVHDPIEQKVVPASVGQSDGLRHGMIHEPDPATGRRPKLLQCIADRDRLFQPATLSVQGPQDQPIAFVSQAIAGQVRSPICRLVQGHRCLTSALRNLDRQLPGVGVGGTPDSNDVILNLGAAGPQREEE